MSNHIGFVKSDHSDVAKLFPKTNLVPQELPQPRPVEERRPKKKRLVRDWMGQTFRNLG